MRLPLLVPALFFCLALPAAAQSDRKAAEPKYSGSVYERAKQRCLEQRGTDCKTREGLKPWIVEEKPMTREQQQAGAAAARRRGECSRSKGKAGC
jgi:hypothetical protein